MTKCVATAVTRNSGSSGRNRDTVWEHDRFPRVPSQNFIHWRNLGDFRPADFRDRATYADPHQYPSGSRTAVPVNGAIVVENFVHTGALPGKVLRTDHAGRVG